MQILSAPIQEYTDAAFRNAHSRMIGGVDEYYLPFLRLEHGELPKRAMMDCAAENNRCPHAVAQLLARTASEAEILRDHLVGQGYRRLDLNLGCPFPKVVKGGYGAGMLSCPEGIREVLTALCASPELRISVKMRLGVSSETEWREVLPILNDLPLEKIVLHPRTAEMQYDGAPNREQWLRFQTECRHPVIYNGDIRCVADADGFDGVMAGRGLLADPLLPLRLRGNTPSTAMLASFHDAYCEECCRLYQQPLLKLKLLWEYFLPDAERRFRKAIQKAKTLEEYRVAVSCLLEALA